MNSISRLPIALLLFVVGTTASRGVPPPNDAFAARIQLTGPSVTTTGDNTDATHEGNENIRDGLFGSTVWWKWTATVTGWAFIDTSGSAPDAVVQLSTGADLSTQVFVGYNDFYDVTDNLSPAKLWFFATMNTEYNIAIGGWDGGGGPSEGPLSLKIRTGADGEPLVIPNTFTFAPASLDVTAASRNTTLNYTLAEGTYHGAGTTGFVFVRPDSTPIAPILVSATLVSNTPWDTTQPQGGSPQAVVTIAPFAVAGAWDVMAAFSAANGDVVTFGGPNTGVAGVLPPGATTSLTVINTGPQDTGVPEAASFNPLPNSVNVTAGPVSLNVSANITDDVSGVAEAIVELLGDVTGFAVQATLTRTAGTPLDGTWTGTLIVPEGWPTTLAGVRLIIRDAAFNRFSYGRYDTDNTDMPGGNIDIDVVGGGAYEFWAYDGWFAPGSNNFRAHQDANGDGVLNVAAYAFGLDPFSGLPAGLPEVTFVDTGNGRKLRISYLRRIGGNTGLTYTPQFTSDVSGLWENATGAEGVVPVDTFFEMVTIQDSLTIGQATKRWGRVKVQYDSTP